MSDLLHTILANPELSEWPRYRTPAGEAEADLYPETHVQPEDTDNEPEWPADEHPAPAAEKLRALIPSDNDNDYSPATAESMRLGFDPAPQPPAQSDTDDRTAQTDTLPADTSSADDADGPDESALTPPRIAFDDIAAKPNTLSAAVSSTGQWFKDRDWKNPRTLAIAAAIVIAACSLMYWSMGSTPDPQGPTAQITPTATDPNPGPVEPPPVRSDAPVTISAATARCPAPSSDPMNAVRPESTKPWICVRAWQIDGQVLELNFDKAYAITAVSIMPGANSEEAGEDQWAKYRTVERLSYAFNDAAHTRCTQETGSLRQIAPLTVTPANCSHKGPWQPVIASAVSITIQKTAEPSNPNTLGGRTSDPGGSDYTAFAVSRLEIIGHPAG